MMKKFLPYLRLKVSKPIPKKGTPEYLEMQKRLIERKTKVQVSEPVLTNEPVPKFFKYMLAGSAFPSTIGMICMMMSDYDSKLYNSSLALAGTWIGTSTVLLSSYSLGLEMFCYSFPNYLNQSNYLFTGRMVCIQSSITGDWLGFLGFFVWLLGNTLSTIRHTEQQLIPLWLGNSHWPWLVHTQLVVVFITYSLICKSRKENKS